MHGAMLSGEAGILLIKSGQIFTLPPGHQEWQDDEFPSLLAITPSGHRLVVQANKVIEVLLAEHAKLCALDGDGSEEAIFKEIKEHVETKFSTLLG